jgi:hypothetical protein
MVIPLLALGVAAAIAAFGGYFMKDITSQEQVIQVPEPKGDVVILPDGNVDAEKPSLWTGLSGAAVALGAIWLLTRK